MALKLMAATRLLADWFDDLSPEAQRKYVEQHPDSKHAEAYDNARDAEPKDDRGDAERIKTLRKQISQVTQDVREIEADGEDASFEKKHLKSLQDELKDLTS